MKKIDIYLNILTSKEFLECKDILLRSKDFKVRVLIIEKLYNIGFYKSANDLEKEASSKYVNVRNLARYYMSKFADYDFIKLYLSNLNNSDYREAAILRFCKVEKLNKLMTIKSFLNSISLI